MDADLVVVGLGAMGAAVAWHAARLGLDTIGIDRHEPPHTMGSTHAETRVTRLAVGEGDQYLPFVARSHELWRELEASTGEALLHACGGYIASEPAAGAADRWTDFTAATAAIAARSGVDYEVLGSREFSRREPNVIVPDAMSVGFEPSAGIVMCERALLAQLDAAESAGARLSTGETVLSVQPVGQHVRVETDRRVITTASVVMAAGAWTPDLMPTSIGDRLTVTRQVVYWFEVDDLDAWSTERFSFLMWISDTIDQYLGVFPVPPDSSTPGLKVLGEQFVHATSPEAAERTVSTAEIADFHQRLIAPRLRGVTDRCLRAEVCLYTNTPDDHFVIERDPRSDRIVVMSPCSGHGFKHSAALGEAVAQHVVAAESDLDLAPFGLG